MAGRRAERRGEGRGEGEGEGEGGGGREEGLQAMITSNHRHAQITPRPRYYTAKTCSNLVHPATVPRPRNFVENGFAQQNAQPNAQQNARKTPYRDTDFSTKILKYTKTNGF